MFSAGTNFHDLVSGCYNQFNRKRKAYRHGKVMATFFCTFFKFAHFELDKQKFCQIM